MKNFLKSVLTILFVNGSLVQAQSLVKESDLIQNNGLYYYESNPFTGIVYTTYDKTSCLKSKREILEGRISGLCIEFFEPKGYEPNKYQDSLVLNGLNDKLIELINKKNSTASENKLLNKELEEFRNTRIKSSAKFEKIKQKGIEGKLKGKDLILYNEYYALVQEIAINGNLWQTYAEEIQLLENQISKEKSKPIYVSKLYLEYHVVDNVKEGVFKKFDINGQIIELGNYTNGKQSGEWSFYYPNGKLKGKGSFENGDGGDLGSSGVPRNGRAGKWFLFNEFGVLSQETSYVSGKIEGISKTYNENGKLIIEELFSQGRLDGIRREYYPSGKLKIENNYKHGLQEGLQKEYFENGNLKCQTFAKSGKSEGQYKEYYENGKIKVEALLKNGILHGPTKTYYESGKLQMQGNIDSTSQFEGHLFGDIVLYNEDGTIKTKAYVNRDGTIIDKTPKPESNLSKSELNKTYRCKCCKSTINGILDGVSQDGSSAEKEMVELFYITYSKPSMKEILAIAGHASVYDFIRDYYGFCTMKCSRTCYK